MVLVGLVISGNASGYVALAILCGICVGLLLTGFTVLFITRSRMRQHASDLVLQAVWRHRLRWAVRAFKVAAAATLITAAVYAQTSPPEDVWAVVNSSLAVHLKVLWIPFMVVLAVCTLLWIEGDCVAVIYADESTQGSAPRST